MVFVKHMNSEATGEPYDHMREKEPISEVASKWRGILKESKSYMNYPKCGRVWFWLHYPAAWLKFHRLQWGSKLRYFASRAWRVA